VIRADPPEVFDTLESLPPDVDALFAAGAARSFHLSRAWFRTVLDAALPAGARPLFLLCRVGGRAVVLWPLLRDGARLQGLGPVYTCLYQPLTAPEASAAELRAAGLAFGRFCRAWPTVRLDALDAEWPGLAPLLAGVRAAGLWPLRFDHFGNWHEAVAGLDWDGYLAARPGALRETIRRRLRRAERDSGVVIEAIDGLAGLADGIAAYETVYARSWKEPEPFPAFGPALLHAAAAEGVLLLGILRQDGRPVATQYWIVAGGVASVLKLAHDEAASGRSPGTVLTAVMVRRLLAGGGVAELDFGRGDDAYKAHWATRRRQRIGVVLANPWRVEGGGAVVRHLAGVVRRRGLAILGVRDLLSARMGSPHDLYKTAR
jgi:CelD/BcsL family acetyltransferase involved in cellulose biosynthesis